MKMFKRMLESCKEKVKSYISQKVTTYFNRKFLLKLLRKSFFGILLSIFPAIFLTLNSGIVITFIVILTAIKYHLILLLLIAAVLIPLSIYDFVQK
ncbi:hypothetical protein COM08_31775 [Bacillus wiedmannii]|uniref:hypothetical protein n=1 Tax=Bacillus wiedmannii TaxID=1890302 RepID=UPI000BF632FF|nr:hypothetical protein [Bacillus wiedmannii]PGB56873.1 hypothetical protein COL95_02395 [Bacillus anthracis]PGC08451.1 hypothetical protein COM08_31775 [Bacillus wiedmannii]